MSKEKKELIISKANSLIQKSGYAAMGMRELAKAVGIEAPSLYNHLQSKEEILNHTCFTLGRKLLTALDEVNDIYFDAEQKLRTAIKNHVEIITQDLSAAYVFIHEWKHLSEPNLSDFKILRDKYEAGIREIVEAGEKEGIFKETDLKFATLSILSAVNWIIEWYRPEGSMTPIQIAEKISDFILQGLTKDKRFN